MSELKHNGSTIQTTSDTWQTRARGTNADEYEGYLAFANDGNGGDITRDGKPLLSYDDWLQS